MTSIQREKILVNRHYCLIIADPLQIAEVEGPSFQS